MTLMYLDVLWNWKRMLWLWWISWPAEASDTSATTSRQVHSRPQGVRRCSKMFEVVSCLSLLSECCGKNDAVNITKVGEFNIDCSYLGFSQEIQEFDPKQTRCATLVIPVLGCRIAFIMYDRWSQSSTHMRTIAHSHFLTTCIYCNAFSAYFSCRCHEALLLLWGKVCQSGASLSLCKSM